MSGRIYDIGSDPRCIKCGSVMWTSKERNFNGPRCSNLKCDGGTQDAKYANSIFEIYVDPEKVKPVEVEYDKNGKFILKGIFTTFDRKSRTQKQMDKINMKIILKRQL